MIILVDILIIYDFQLNFDCRESRFLNNRAREPRLSWYEETKIICHNTFLDKYRILSQGFNLNFCRS